MPHRPGMKRSRSLRRKSNTSFASTTNAPTSRCTGSITAPLRLVELLKFQLEWSDESFVVRPPLCQLGSPYRMGTQPLQIGAQISIILRPVEPEQRARRHLEPA